MTQSEAPSLLLLSLLVFLFPLAIYCWVLAILNRRLSPLLVRGVWDAVGLLFAISGFFLVVAPHILTHLYLKVVQSIPVEVAAEDADVVGPWWILWALYYLVVAGIAFFLVWLRRNKSVIYNVDPNAFPLVFQDCLHHLGLDLDRLDNRWRLFPAREPPSAAHELSEAFTPNGSPGDGPMVRASTRQSATDAWPPNAFAEVVVDVFPAMCNVTLHWRRHDPRIRNRVEAHLAEHLADARPDDNPAAGWLLGLCGFLFGLVLLIAAMLIFLAYIPPRRW